MYKSKASAEKAYAGYRAKGREIMTKKEVVYTCECIECGWTTKTSEHCNTIKCEKCGGTMRRKARPGPGKESMLAEPGIDPGSKTAKYYRVRQKSPGQFQRFRQQPFGKVTLGIQVVYGFHRKLKKMQVQALLFLKTKWTVPKIRVWIKAHKFIVMPENWMHLHKLSVVMRRTFNYRLSLALEWREFYLQALKEDKPDPRVWAWYKFESKYMKSESGRWILRQYPKAS